MVIGIPRPPPRISWRVLCLLNNRSDEPILGRSWRKGLEPSKGSLTPKSKELWRWSTEKEKQWNYVVWTFIVLFTLPFRFLFYFFKIICLNFIVEVVPELCIVRKGLLRTGAGCLSFQPKSVVPLSAFSDCVADPQNSFLLLPYDQQQRGTQKTKKWGS